MKSKILFVLGVGLAVLFILRFRGVLVAANVNRQQITRLELARELEKQAGSQALDSLITRKLILDEAKRQKISVSNDELNGEISKIEEQLKAQNQSLDEALTSRGLNRKDLEDQIRFQILLQKMVNKDIEVTDEEVENYIKDTKTTDSKENVKEDLKQQKVSEKIQAFLTDLRTKAKIDYFVTF